MDFAICEIFPSLHEEINSLNKKLERVSKGTMTFAMSSKDERTPFKRPYTNTLMWGKTSIIAKIMFLQLGVTIVV